MHEIRVERRRLSRRRLLAGSATVAGAGLVAATIGVGRPLPGLAHESTPAVEMGSPFANDIEVLNYSLTLEHL